MLKVLWHPPRLTGERHAAHAFRYDRTHTHRLRRYGGRCRALSGQIHTLHRALSARRHQRHDGAHRRPTNHQHLQTIGGGRQPPGRQRDDRRRDGGQSAGRRLYLAGDHHYACHQRDAVSRRPLRSAERFSGGVDTRLAAAGGGGEFESAGQIAGRAQCTRQNPHAQWRFKRQRYAATPGTRTLPPAGRH